MKFSLKKFIRAEYPARQSFWGWMGMLAIILMTLRQGLLFYFGAERERAIAYYVLTSFWIIILGLIPLLIFIWNAVEKCSSSKRSLIGMVYHRACVVISIILLALYIYGYFNFLLPTALNTIHTIVDWGQIRELVLYKNHQILALSYAA